MNVTALAGVVLGLVGLGFAAVALLTGSVSFVLARVHRSAITRPWPWTP